MNRGDLKMLHNYDLKRSALTVYDYYRDKAGRLMIIEKELSQYGETEELEKVRADLAFYTRIATELLLIN